MTYSKNCIFVIFVVVFTFLLTILTSCEAHSTSSNISDSASTDASSQPANSNIQSSSINSSSEINTESLTLSSAFDSSLSASDSMTPITSPSSVPAVSAAPDNTVPSVILIDSIHRTSEGERTYTLSDSEAKRFLELLDAVKTEPLPPQPPLDGGGPCYVRIIYPDRENHLILPEFIMDGEYRKTTAGAQELVDYVNSLDFYKESGYNVTEDLPGRHYIVGREDGVVQIKLYSNAFGETFYLNSEEAERFLRELNNVSFIPTGETVASDFHSEISIHIKRLDYSDSYKISNIWVKNRQVCNVSDSEKLIELIDLLIAEHSPQ